MNPSLLALVLCAIFVTITGACRETFTDLSGTFTSPNFPANYPNNEKCVYKIKTGYSITLTCSVFDLQPANSRGRCNRDFMKVKEKGQKTEYCGSSGPNSYTSTTSRVKIVFKSNKKVTRQGFSCTYTSIVDITETTTTAEEPMAALLASALADYESNTCNFNPGGNCGCSGTLQSEHYTTTTGGVRIVAANGIPNHVYEEGQANPNPNTACPNKVYMAVPLNPTKGTTYTQYGMGPVGIATSGGFFYNHLSSPMGDVAVVNEGPSFDTCNGHSDPSCRYHYHMVPKCIAGEGNCAFVGYMRDGFPVYSYCTHETESRYLKSCYYLQSGDGSMTSHYTYNTTAYNNGDCDLDEANGYTFSDERGYSYIFTEDYPFIMAGYYGTELATMCTITSA